MTGEKFVESVTINDGNNFQETEGAHEGTILACCDGKEADLRKSARKVFPIF